MKKYGETIYIVYLMIIATFSIFMHKIIFIENAMVFDKYYANLIVISVIIYSIVFYNKSLVTMLKNFILIGLVISGIAYLVFYILNKSNYYFSFEMEGYSWNGIFSILKIIIYLLISCVIGIVIWGTRRIVLKIILNKHKIFHISNNDLK